MSDRSAYADASLAAVVARRHLVLGEAKIDIAGDLGISRFKVARLLDYARESGMVRIEIVPPAEVDERISADLGAALGLEWCVVTTDSEDQISTAAAELLNELLGAGDVLGLPWSRSVNRMVEVFTTATEVPVVQLSGAMVTPGEESSAVDVVRRAARITKGPAQVFYSPILLDDAAAASMMRRHRDVRNTLRAASAVTVAVVGVGAWCAGGSTIYDVVPTRARKSVVASGAVGEIAGVFFDADGAIVETPLTSRIVALTGKQLHGIPAVLGIAHGADKVPAIAAAARGRLISGLVTTSGTAHELLQAQG